MGTPQPMLVRAHHGLDSSRALQKKKKSQNRENRTNKNRVQGSAYVFAWALRALDSAPQKSLSSSAFIHATQAALYTAVCLSLGLGYLGSQGRRKSRAAYVFVPLI